jgi:16S rRNA (guanine527-N7)-methyltransferase
LSDQAHSPPAAEAIAARAAAAGVALSPDAARLLASHAAMVLQRNDELHLTGIREPAEFLERHLGESLEGAALLTGDATGTLLDLGSGNGYPGLPVAAARPGLRPLLAEAAARKAAFLREVLAAGFPAGEVIERQLQRPADLAGIGPLRALVTRAAGSWERILPRLSGCLEPGGTLLIWAGASMESVMERRAWQRYRFIQRRALPGRDHSWVWCFAPRG